MMGFKKRDDKSFKGHLDFKKSISLPYNLKEKNKKVKK